MRNPDKSFDNLKKEMQDLQNKYDLLKLETEKIEQGHGMLFNLMDEGVAINEIISDEKGNAIDYTILDVNPAFTKNSSFTRE